MDKRINNYIIFGGSELSILAIQLLIIKGSNIRVVTSPRQIDEMFSDTCLREVCSSNNIEFEILDSIDSISSNIDFTNTIGLSFGAPWVFPKSFALKFGGGLYDFMCIDVPRYRGGAHHSWQILNKETKFAHCLQRIIGDQETYHQGDILLKHEFTISLDLIESPKKLFQIHLHEAKKFMQIIFNHNLNLLNGSKPNLSDVRYYPFLNTHKQAFINWGWDSTAVADFINAFSAPYCGAATFYQGKEVKILGRSEVLNEYCHPFAAGIITNISKTGIIVGGNGRLINISLDVSDNFQIGERFYTPLKKLDQIFRTNISYGGSGMKVKIYGDD